MLPAQLAVAVAVAVAAPEAALLHPLVSALALLRLRDLEPLLAPQIATVLKHIA